MSKAVARKEQGRYEQTFPTFLARFARKDDLLFSHLSSLATARRQGGGKIGTLDGVPFRASDQNPVASLLRLAALCRDGVEVDTVSATWLAPKGATQPPTPEYVRERARERARKVFGTDDPTKIEEAVRAFLDVLAPSMRAHAQARRERNGGSTRRPRGESALSAAKAAVKGLIEALPAAFQGRFKRDLAQARSLEEVYQIRDKAVAALATATANAATAASRQTD